MANASSVRKMLTMLGALECLTIGFLESDALAAQ